MSKTLVAVCCNTYNHEKYIRQTLQGFVDQKTTFAFRVIVHDDASTDGTQCIMQEFEKKYPELFYMIYEKENQYSKDVDCSRDIVYPLIHEPYTAICEGDDYWCDPAKLQNQVDYMEAHPECSLCVHDTMRIDAEGHELMRVNGYNKDKDYSANDIIAAGGGVLFHTSSFLARTAILQAKPDEISIEGIGDYPNAIHLSMQGNVHYFSNVMSCYRVGVPGSWSTRESNTVEKMLKRNRICLDAMNRMDEYTHGKYKKGFDIEKGCMLAYLYRHEYGVAKLLQHPDHLRMVLLWARYKIRLKTLGKGVSA